MPDPKPDPCPHPEPLEVLTLACGDVVRRCTACNVAWLPGKIHKIDVSFAFDFGDDDDREAIDLPVAVNGACTGCGWDADDCTCLLDAGSA